MYLNFWKGSSVFFLLTSSHIIIHCCMLLLLTICFLLVLIFQLMQLFPMLQNFVVIVVVEWNNFSSMCKNANKFLAIIILAAFIKLRYNCVQYVPIKSSTNFHLNQNFLWWKNVFLCIYASYASETRLHFVWWFFFLFVYVSLCSWSRASNWCDGESDSA